MWVRIKKGTVNVRVTETGPISAGEMGPQVGFAGVIWLF
ncbi:hypothetical protein ABH899_002234 [Paenibacillus sp. RC84]